MMDKAQSRTVLERDLIQKVAEVENNVTWLDVFSRSAWYGPTECLAYPRMVSCFGGGGALLYVMLDLIR